MIQKFLYKFSLTTFFVFAVFISKADVFSDAAARVNGYASSAMSLFYAIAALMGIVGALKVFKKFQNGGDDVVDAAGGWLAGCIFCVIVGAVIQGFFVS